MRRNIRKILFIAFWCIIGAGVLVLLGAAIKSRNSKTCSGWKIVVNSPTGQPFVDKNDVMALLTAWGSEKWQGRPIMSFDLRKMEDALEKNPWISDAQLFFDNNQVLRMNITEREPVARIFTATGTSFYMDSSGAQIPLSAKFSARLPVFTGFPSAKIRLRGNDSALISQIKSLSAYVRSQPFWMAQLQQIDITSSGTFEMVPVLGNHLIVFGEGNDIEQKFHRLFVFYKEVLARTGFDKYARIDVQYQGQVIGTKKEGMISRYDSLLALKNIQQLIKSAQQLQADTVSREDSRPLERSATSEQGLSNYDLVPENDSTRGSSPASTTATPALYPLPMKHPGSVSNPPLHKPVSNPPPHKSVSTKKIQPTGNRIPVKNPGPMKPKAHASGPGPEKKPKAIMPKKTNKQLNSSKL